MASTWSRWGRVATPLSGRVWRRRVLQTINYRGPRRHGAWARWRHGLAGRPHRPQALLFRLRGVAVRGLAAVLACAPRAAPRERPRRCGDDSVALRHGLGMGGVTPLATTLMSEWTSKQVRSIAVARCVVASVPVGGHAGGRLRASSFPNTAGETMFLIGGHCAAGAVHHLRLPAAGIAQVHGAASVAARRSWRGR